MRAWRRSTKHVSMQSNSYFDGMHDSALSLKLFSIVDENQETVRFLAQVNNKSESMWAFFFNGLIKWGSVYVFSSAVLTTLLSLRVEGEYVTQYSYHSYKAVYVNQKVFEICIIFFTAQFFLNSFQFALGSNDSDWIHRRDNLWLSPFHCLCDCWFVHVIFYRLVPASRSIL